jgi:hypothetical protein
MKVVTMVWTVIALAATPHTVTMVWTVTALAATPHRRSGLQMATNYWPIAATKKILSLPARALATSRRPRTAIAYS